MQASGQRKVVGRLAPSPTGRMHAGNIFAALMCWLVVKSQQGSVVLRIEDLDVERSRKEYADQIMRDFEALGLVWDEGPFFQQGRDQLYEQAFQSLRSRGLVYPCFCTRADLRALSAPHRGEKTVYPGICRNLAPDAVLMLAEERKPAYRLQVSESEYEIHDLVQGRYSQVLSQDCGDFVIRRSDGLFAYQLASVVDDGLQGVNCIVRGVDLLPSTPQQAYLQNLLGLGSCAYAHVPLIVAERNRRLSKRDHDASLEMLLERHKTPQGVLGHVAYVAGLVREDEPATPEELLREFKLEALPRLFNDPIQIQWR